MKLIIWCLLATAVHGQSIVASGGRSSIVIAGRQDPPAAAEPAPVPEKPPEPVVQEVPKPSVSVPVAPVVHAAPSNVEYVEHWLVSEPWCVHCPAAKRRFLAAGHPADHIISIREAARRHNKAVTSVPYQYTTRTLAARSEAVQPPVRYIQWPGWGTIDLETYNRNCNCSMCRSIRAKQAEYRTQMEAFRKSQVKPQAQVTPDQEGCPYELVETMLDQMELRSWYILGDLGCGDGRILIAAARRGIRGIGIEIDPARAEVARRNVKAAGVEHLVTIETGDALEFDTGRVTAVTAYLYPPLLAKLSPKLRGKRVVASPYHEVPGLGMKQAGDIWIYRTGG